jgi:hypothetical protein
MNLLSGKNVLRSWWTVLLGLSLLTARSAARDQWLSASTGHFEVLTNASEREARVLVGRLEQFRENFLGILPGAPFHEPRTTVVIFRTEKDFRPYKPLYNGKPKEDLAGYFQGLPDEVVIALTTDRDLEQTIPVIYHEYIHLLMHARGYRLPPWLNEGIAELYATMEFEEERVRVGKHNPFHVMLLNRSRLMPLAQLFSVTQASPDYNEGDRRGIFYAQSWALVHYCLTGKRKNKDLGEDFSRLLAAMQRGLPPERCVQESFGMSLKDLEDELGGHVRGGQYFVKNYKVPKVDFEARVKFRPASDFERDVALMNLKWRIQQNGDATMKMLEFAEREPTAARPYEVLAAMAMLDQERKRAIDYWQMAAARKSTNAFVYEELAEDSMRQYLAGISLDFRLPDDEAAQLRGWLDRALALDPDYAEAWEWLALTEAFSKKMRGAVVNKAVAKRQLLAMRPRFMVAISLIALRLENQERLAGQIAGSLLARPDVMAVRPGANGSFGGGVNGPASGRGASWMLKQEYYPDVQFIAKAIQRRLQKEKPAASEEPEPAEFNLPDAR